MRSRAGVGSGSWGRWAFVALAALLLPASAGATVDSALSQARSWLIAQQNPDGSFGPGAELLPRDSAAAVLALTGGPADPAIGRGADYLTALPESVAYYRALRVQALARAGSPFTALVATLDEFRNGEGMGAFGTYYSNLFDTTQAIEAYAEDESTHQLEIVPLLDYLRTSQATDGGWGYLPGNPSQVYYTGEALWAVTRLHTLAVTPQVIANARTYLLGKLQSNGSFGSVLETAVAYRALIGSGYQFTAAQPDVVAALLAAQRPDGSWDGDAYTTAEVVRALATYRPNLVIAALSAPGTTSAGTTVQVSVTVQNIGPQGAAASRLVLRAGSATSTDVRAEAAVPALAAGATFAATLPVATAGDTGELVLYAVADADGTVAEESELDNARSVRIALTGLPDLAVFPANFSLSVLKPQPLTAFSIRATIQNLGEQQAPVFGYRLTRVVAGVPVQNLSTSTKGPLGPGASLILDVTNVSLPEGEHTVRLELDYAGTIAEASEEDNVAEYTFFVVDDTLADLSLADADFTTTPVDAVPGQPVNVSLIVRNKGNQSGTAVVDFFVGESTTGTPVLTKSTNVNANSTATVTGSFTPAASAVVLTAVVDRAGTVRESDENNNRARRYLRTLPDLAVGFDGTSLTPEHPLAGDTTTVRITVRNAGSLASEPAPVALFAGLPEAGGTEVGRATVAAIPAAGNATVEVPWTAAGGATDLVVVVDPDDAILERSESNNRTVRRVTVQRASGPNLAVSAVDLAQATHSALDLRLTGTVGLTVANQGTAATAGAYLVRLFEDRDGDRRFAAPADRDLGSTVLDQPLAAGATAPVTFAVDTTLAFAHSLVLAEVDALDTVAETREDDNQRSIFGDCEEATPAASLEPVEKWWLPEVDVQSTPAVVQLSDDNGDGLIDSRDNPDVVTHASDAQGRLVLAVSGLDGSQLWSFRSTAANPLQSEKANIAAADLDGDGVVEVLAVQTNGRLVALDNKGLVRWTSEQIESTGGDWRGGSAVGDLTGDGVPEIVVGRAVLSNTGKRIAVGTANAARNHNYYGPFGTPYLYDQQHAIIADVDLDGRNEIVAGDTVYRLVDGVLTVVWDYVEHDNMLKDGFAAVGNLDTDAFPEIVYVSAGFVKVIQHDGFSPRGSYARIVPIQPPIGEGSSITFWGGPPTIADLTGDGKPEILVAGDSQLVAFNTGLGAIWRKPTFDFAAMTSATAFDLDGDGKREVIYNDEGSLFILDGPTGEVRFQKKNTSLTGTELPVVADLDNDGAAEILVGSNRDRNGDGSTRGLHVFGHPGWRGTRPIWNQHSYHVTNVQLDGTVPAHEVPSWQLTNTFRANLELPRVEQRQLPNVTIGLPRIGAAGAQGIPVTLRIGNGGAAPVGAGVDITLAAQSGGPAVGSGSTRTALAPGEWEDVIVYWQAAISGPVAAVAVVDPAEAVDECDRTDNRIELTVEERLLPDLSIPATGITASGIATAGQLIDFAVQVKNHGPAASPATVVRVTDGTVPLGEAALAALAPTATATVTVHVDTLLLSAGLHSFHATVDPDGLIPEVDEDNNGGLFPLDLAAANKPDLTPVTLTVEPSSVSAGATATLRVEVLNRGTALAGGFQLSFKVNGAEVSKLTHPGQIDNAGRVMLTYALSTLGRQGTLQVSAVVDPANLVAEVNETNNTATASLAVASSPVSLVVTSDKTRYKPSETAQLSVTAVNGGSQPLAGTLRIALQDSLGAEVELIGERAVTLPTGGSAHAFTWPAFHALPGPYFAVATFLRDGVAVALGQTSFSVAPDVSLAAQIATDQAVYRPSTTVIVTGGVRNTATSTLVAGTSAKLTISNPGGQQVFEQTSTLGQLLPGGFLPIAGTWPVGTAAPGLYRAELRILSSTNELLALATTSFGVESTADTGTGIRGTLTVTPALQGVGGAVAVEYSLENRGNAAAPGLVAHLEMLALATGEPVRTLDVPTTLAAGGGASGRWRIDTADLPPSAYLVSLSAVVGGVVSSLGSDPVTLLPGLLADDLELHEGDGGTHSAQVTVRLLPANELPVTVDYATADGSAIAGEDYAATSGTLTFAPGETTKTIAIDVFGDVDAELHETLLVNLSAPAAALIADAQAVVTLEDEEGCASTNLLRNGGGEEVALEGAFAGWTGTGWDGGFAAPAPFEGSTYFLARTSSPVELVQDVSLLPFATRIDAGGQAFVFEGFVSAATAAARVVVEYRDQQGQVLDSFDSGLLGNGLGWQAVVDQRPAPPGTREARVRLLASGAAAVAFDRLALRSVGVVTLFAADETVVESAAQARLSLALSCGADAPVAVAFQTADLEAKAGEDYDAKNGVVTFVAGEMAATVDVMLRQDVLDEEAERFQVALTSGDVVVIANPATVTVEDDDGAVSLSAAPAAVSEGDSGTVDATFLLTLSSPSGREVRVSYAAAADTAAAGSDFTAASGTVTFAPGTTEREVRVAVVGDRVDELVETFRLVLSSPQYVTLATASADGTIVDDDTAALAVVDTEVVEGSASAGRIALVPVNLSIASDRTVTVAYTTVADTAANPADFTATSGTLSFPAGATQKTISVPIVGDAVEEVTETFLVVLSDPQQAELGDPEATVTILDEDGPNISITDVTLSEGNSGTKQALFTVTSLRPLPDVVWIEDALPTGASPTGDAEGWNWVSTNPVPFSGSLSHQSNLVSGTHQHYFTGASSTLTINAGDLMVAYVYLDPTSPPTEVMLQWNDGSWDHRAYWGANQIGFGSNNTNSRRFMGPLPPTGQWVRLEVPASIVGLENRTLNGMAFTLFGGRATWDHAGKGQHYEPASTRTVTVDVATADGTAVAVADYTALTTTLTFAPGEIAKSVAVDVIGEKVEEPDETFLVRLQHPTNAAILRAEAVGTILDDDVFTISVADLYLAENKPEAQLRLTLNRASEDPITVRIATVDDVALAGQDYTSVDQTVTFAPGSTLQVVPIALLDDAVHEGPERFWVDLSQVVNAHLARTRVGVHLLDDEKPASYPLATTVRDFKAPHPDIHNCGSVPRPAALLGPDGKMVYSSGGTGAPNFLQWYRDTTGVNLNAPFDLTFGQNGAVYQSAPASFFPIDGKLYGNEGGHNYNFTAELHAWFTFEPGATFYFGSDDDGWCFINNQLAIDRAACHGFSAGSVTLSNIAATFGLVQGESYRVDCFQAERGQGASNFYFETPLYLQQFEPGTLQIAPQSTTVAEGATASLQVERIGGAFGTVTATAVSAGGTATPDVDYPSLSVPVVRGHGVRTPLPLPVATTNDAATEGEETIRVDLVQPNPTGAVGPFGTATVTLMDDESFPVVGLLSSALPEGSRGEQTMMIGITLTGENRYGATINYTTADGTAVVNSDYRALSGTLVWKPGESHKFVELKVIGDTTIEPDEWLELVLTGSGFLGGSARLRLDLVDDDNCGTPNLMANPDFSQAISGGQVPGWTTAVGAWTNYNSGGSWQGLNVYLANSPGGELYQDIDLTGFEQFINRGQQRFALRVEVASWAGDNPPDTTRFVLELRDASNTTVLQSFDSREGAFITGIGVMSTVVTAPPSARWARVRLIGKRYVGGDCNSHFDRAVLMALAIPAIAADDKSFAEGHAGPTAANLPVTLSCPSSVPVSFEYATVDGTARAGQDYQSAIGVLTIPVGTTTGTIPLTILGDTLTEGTETFEVLLQGSSGAVIVNPETTVTITDDESKLSIAGDTKTEGNSGSILANVKVSLDKAMTLPVTVDYATESYSALAGEDFVAASGTLTFAPNELQKTISVEILGDTNVEPDEELYVVLTNPSNAAIAVDRAAVRIRTDDIEVTIADARIAEGNSGQRDAVFEVRLSMASTQAVSVAYQTVDGLAGAGADYLTRSGTLSFSAGTVLATIKVPVLGDTAAEGSETFLVRLSNPQNANVVQPEATGFIIDDDDCPSANLLVNPGAEQATSGEISFWREVQSTTWGTRSSSPSAVEGSFYFAAGNDAVAELAQDVDVSAFAIWIDEGVQRFSFEGFARSAGSPLDVARVVVEYRDAANAAPLATFDSGAITDSSTWRYVSDLTTVPVGTRWIRVRLIGVRQQASSNTFAFFDGLSLRSLGTPILQLPDREVTEGDESSVVVPYELRLTCAGERPVSLSFATIDGTARAGVDYKAATGTLTYGPTDAVKTVDIETFGDFLSEIRETFRLQVSEVTNAVVLDGDATITLADADTGAPVAGTTRVYTLDNDFDLGFAVGVNHDAPNNDQLQLDEQGGTFPFLWVAASGRGTIVKIDTRSGQVLGEFSTNPDNLSFPNPSRTTVSFDGSVWVGNRGNGSVAHIGLRELGQCLDRNGNGTIETSTGYGNVLPWPNAQGQDTNGGVSTAADECILHFVKVRESIPRHLSIDGEGKIWVGGFEGTCSSCFDQLDGTTGATLRQVNLPCGGYGGFVDSNGVLWSSHYNAYVMRWDPATPTSTARCLGVPGAYGLAISDDGEIYANDHWNDRIWKVALDGTIQSSFLRGSPCGQGLAVDAAGHVWSSSSRACGGTQISHVRGDGTFIGTLDNVPSGSTGVAVDDNGKVWAVADQASKAFRIDPTQGPIGADGVSHVGAVDLVVDLPGANPYNYSDMTGFQALRHTLRQGSWSTIQDAGLPGAEWGVVSWNTEPQASVPAGSSIVVEVRTAELVSALGSQSWLQVTSGQRFQRFGRYLQVRVTLRLGSATASPVLSDLRIGIQEPDVRVDDVTVTEGDSGTTPATFTVTLSETVAHAVTISYRTVAGSASADTDFTATTGTLVIPAGSLSAAITVPVVGDTVDEEDETFTFELTAAAGGKLVDPAGEGRILDDDTRLVVSATKTAELADDRDGNGSVTPGDVLGYTVVVRNIGAAALTGLVFEDVAPAGTQIVSGSVTAEGGSVQDESPVQVAIPSLAVDATVTVRFRVAIGVPWTSGPAVVNQGRVAGLPNGAVLTDDPVPPGTEDPTVTPLAAVPVLAAKKTDALPTDGDADGDGQPSPGDTLRYTIVLANTGTVDATGVVLVDSAPPHTTLVAGSATTTQGTIVGESPLRVELGTLPSNGGATVTLAVRVDNPVATGVDEVSNQATVNSAELPAVLSDDPDVPGRQDPTVTPIAAAPRLLVTKTDELAIDADFDDQPSPGDTIGYTVKLRNVGNTAATAVTIRDATPDNTTFVDGSVTLSTGTLRGVDPIVAEVTELAVGAEVELTFRVRIVSPIEPWVREVVNQATVTSAELDEVLSNDPDLPGVANPTRTPVAAAPVLALSKTDALHTDPNNDGYASPGEVVQYQLTLTNTGNTAATSVELTDPVPDFATLEAGSLQTSMGTATEGDPVRVTIDRLAAGGTATVSFRIRIADPFPANETELVNQASVAATELAPVASDDPATAEPRDATRTPVIRLVDVSVADLTLAENAGTASFVVTLSEASRVPVTVSYSVTGGSATAGADFTTVADTLTIPAGQTQGTIAVPVLDDSLDEPDETFTLTLATPVGALLADATAVATIVDDDAPPSLTLADVSVTEGDSGTTPATFTLTLSAPSAFAIAVDYATATGTAGVGDFTAASGTVSFAPGELSRTVTVNALGDLLDEADETFTLQLSNPQQVVLARNAATGTILDDDAPPAISIGDVSVDEGNSGTVEARFTVTLSAPSGREVRVAHTTAGLEATADADFQTTPGELAIAAGTTSATVVVPVIGDLFDETDERFELRLAQPVNATPADGIGVGTIRDDDAAPQLSVGDVTVHEGDSGYTNIDVPVRLSTASGFVVSVGFTTADGTAISPADYLSTADTALIPAGATTQTVTLKVRGDVFDEVDETFELRIANPTNATIADGTGSVTIIDDDAPIKVSIGDATVTEGDTGTRPATFTVTLSQVGEGETRVRYATADATAAAGSDYTATSGELVFPAGTTTQALDVPVLGDLLLESDETFEVRLSQPVGADLGDEVGIGTIVDDETCQGPELVFNGGAESRPATGNSPPGWTPLAGTTWTRVSTPAAQAGTWSFSAPVGGSGELGQDVDLRAFAARAAGGALRFALRGAVLATGAANTASGHVVLELRDEANAAVLLTQDLGEVGPGTAWTSQLQVVTAPAGTGWARLRLLAKRTVSASTVNFDGISLRSLRVPVVTVGDMATYEGDSGQHDGIFQLLLACPYDQPVTADYLTVDGTATAGADYLTRSGEVTFAPGTTSTPVPVPVLGDEIYEGHERFTLQASNVEGGDAVLLDPAGEGLILDDDFCPRSPGFWKTHPESWPVTFVVIGGVEYDKTQAMAILSYNGNDAATHLARQLIATKLNLLVGGDPVILPSVEASDAFLAEHPAGSNPGGADRDEANALKAPLEAYNTTNCTGVTPRW